MIAFLFATTVAVVVGYFIATSRKYGILVIPIGLLFVFLFSDCEFIQQLARWVPEDNQWGANLKYIVAGVYYALVGIISAFGRRPANRNTLI